MCPSIIQFLGGQLVFAHVRHQYLSQIHILLYLQHVACVSVFSLLSLS